MWSALIWQRNRRLRSLEDPGTETANVYLCQLFPNFCQRCPYSVDRTIVKAAHADTFTAIDAMLHLFKKKIVLYI